MWVGNGVGWQRSFAVLDSAERHDPTCIYIDAELGSLGYMALGGEGIEGMNNNI